MPGLISGCFEGKPERVLCTYNNGHSRVRHKFLNKDTGRIVVSSGLIGLASTERGLQNGNFERAVSAAIADTKSRWAWLEREILARYGAVRGKAILCGLRNDNESACR